MGESADPLATPADAWTFACPDWVERLKEGRSLVPDLPLDPVAADQAVSIFNKLRLPDVPGQPAMADAAGEWFRDIVRAAFGSLNKDTGVRMVPEIFAEVPKKNSKTTGSAGLMITAMLLNKRPRATMLLVGPTQEVADLAFQQAVGMIEADPEGYLQKRFQIAEHTKTIKDRTNGAKLMVKTFDLKVMTGAKPVIVLVDELHIMSQYSYATRVFGQIRGGLIANPESLLIIITTQSDAPPAGVFKQELDYARKVRDGEITDGARILPVLYEFPPEIQVRDLDKPLSEQAWMDPAIWPMVLPNLGHSITIERLIADFKQARDKGEEEVTRWASQHLNIQIGMAMHASRWRGADFWLKARDKTLRDLDAFLARCEVVTAGIDGGGLDDLMGLALLGRCKATRDFLLWNRAWVQAEVFDLRKDIAEQLEDFVRDGDLIKCRAPGQDIADIVAILKQVKAAGLMPEKGAIGLDPQGVSDLVDALDEAGMGDGQAVAVPQGYRLSGSIWGMERKLKGNLEIPGNNLWHADQPMMAWSVSNAMAEKRGNATLITKQISGSAKIDPLMASFDAYELMSRNPTAVGASVYETRGMRMV